MLKLILLSALFSAALGGYAHGGYEQHHGHGGHGLGGHGHGGHGHGGHGHGWRRPYHGYGWVSVHQTPYSYQYGLNEQGNGYTKYIWQGADFHNSHPVKHAAHGHGYH